MVRQLRAISVGRLAPVKNVDLIIDAWSDIEIPLSVVGDGPEYSKLVRLSRLANLQDRVQFLGERSDVGELMEEADLLVSASEREGFSYVVLEALQSNLVVVSTRTGIAAELVPEEFLMNTPTASSLAEIVNRTVCSIDSAREAFASAWSEAARLTVERMVHETESVYLETLAASRNERP